MRILILSSEFPPGPGGIGTHAYQLARYFSDKDHPVLVLSPQDYASESELSAFNSRHSFSIITFSGRNTSFSKALSRAKLTKKALHDFKPDVVLASGERSIWLSAFVLSRKSIPWVVVGHGTEFGTKFGASSLLTRLTCNQASAVVCVSDYTRGRMASLGIIRPAVKVIHNGADAQYFHIQSPAVIEDFRKEYGVEEKFVLLTVGNVSARKGQEWVIRALPAMVSKHPKLVYWMAGLPTMQKELEALAAQLEVSDHIHFWGRVNQDTLLNLYNTCDLFIMTSQQLKNGDFEGYGIAVIEAALCGKTSVVSDNSGLAEAVQDGVTGILVPQREITPIADAVNSLIDSAILLRKLSAAAHRRANDEQTWEQVSESYLQFFEQIQTGS